MAPPGPYQIDQLRRDLPLMVVGWPRDVQTLILYTADLALLYATGAVPEAAFRTAMRYHEGLSDSGPDRTQ